MVKKLLVLFMCIVFIGCATGGGGDVGVTPVDVCEGQVSVSGFCEKEYLDKYPDVSMSGFAKCASVHYTLFGKAEGRNPCPVTQKEFGSYRGIESDGRVVFRWPKPGDMYPPGVRMFYLKDGIEQMKIIAHPSVDHISYLPNDFLWKAESEHDGNVVLMLPKETAGSYVGYVKGDKKGAWLEYE